MCLWLYVGDVVNDVVDEGLLCCGLYVVVVGYVDVVELVG